VAPPSPTASTKEIEGIKSDRAPSVTRQVASPIQPIEDFGQIDSVRNADDGDPTLMGKNLQDAESRRNAETAERPAGSMLSALAPPSGIKAPFDSETIVAERSAMESMSDA